MRSDVCGVMTTRASTMWRSVGSAVMWKVIESIILTTIIQPAVVMRYGRLCTNLYIKSPMQL